MRSNKHIYLIGNVQIGTKNSVNMTKNGNRNLKSVNVSKKKKQVRIKNV